MLHGRIISVNRWSQPLISVTAWVLFIVSFVFTATAQQNFNDRVIVTDLDWSLDSQVISVGIGRWMFDYLPNVGCQVNMGGIHLYTQSSGEYSNLNTSFGCSATSTAFLNNDILVASSLYFSALLNTLTGEVLESAEDGLIINSVDVYGSSILISLDFGPVIIRPGEPFGRGRPYSITGTHILDAVLVTAATELLLQSDAYSQTIYILEPSTWDRSNQNFYGQFSNHNAIVRRLDWNGANGLVASGDDEGVIWVWDPVTVEPVMQLTGHNGPILDITWNPDGTQIATASADGTVRVWDWPSGTMEIVDSGRLFTAVAYRPDGAQLAYGGEILNGVASLANLGVEIIPAPAIRLPTSTPTPTDTPTSILTPTPTPTRTPTPTNTPIPLPPANTNLLTNPSFASGLAPWQTVNFSAGGVVNGVLEVTQPTGVEFGVVWYNRQRRHSSLGYLSPAQFEQLAVT